MDNKRKDIINKVVFYTLVVLVSVVSAISLSVYNYAKANSNNYIIEFSNDTKLEKLEINNNPVSMQSLVSGDFYLEDELLGSSTDNNQIVMECPTADTFYVKFATVDSGAVYLNGEAQEITNGEYTFVLRTIDIIKESISTNTIFLFIICLVIVYGLLYYIRYFYRKLREEDIKVYHIVFFALALFVLYVFNYYFLYLLLRRFIVIPIILLMLYSVYTIYKMKDKKFENIYAALVAVVGITMIFIMPPFNVPDESSHYMRAYKDSLLNFEEDEDGYYAFPKAIDELAYRYRRNVHVEGNKIYPRNYISDVLKEADYEVMSTYETDYNNVKNLSFVPYVPSTLIFLIGRTLGVSSLLILLLCRLADFLIVSVCAYWAIKKVPCFKKVFLVVCLFPIFIQQCCAINMDYFTNAISVLLVSHLLTMIYGKEKVGKKETGILVVLSLALSLGKFGYFPLLLLLVLVPNDKFKNKKIAWLYRIAFFMAVFVVSFLFNIGATYGGNFGNDSSSNVYGLKYFFTNPLDFIKIMFVTAFNRIDQDIIRGFIDCFAYSTVWHDSALTIFVHFIYFSFILISDENDEKLTKFQRAVFLIIPAMVLAIVYAIALSQWTTKGSNLIWGIQARYFIPILISLYIGVSNSRINVDVKDKKLLYSMLIFAGFAISFLTIAMSFS